MQGLFKSSPTPLMEEKPKISAGLWVRADTSEKEMELSQYKQRAWKSVVPAPLSALQ